MDYHKKVLGILFIVTASLTALFLLFLNSLLSILFTFILSEAEPKEARLLELIFEFVHYIPAFLLVFSCLPSLIAAYGLLAKKSWAMMLSLILGCLKLFSFPVGTCIGIYIIWVYSEDQKLLKQSQSQA